MKNQMLFVKGYPKESIDETEMTVEEAVQHKIKPDNDKGIYIFVVGHCAADRAITYDGVSKTLPKEVIQEITRHYDSCKWYEPASETFKTARQNCFSCAHWIGIAWDEAEIVKDYLNEPDNADLKSLVYGDGRSCITPSKSTTDRLYDLDFMDYEY